MSIQATIAKDRVVTAFPQAYNLHASPYKSLDYDLLVKTSSQRDRTNIGVKLCKAVVVGDVAIGKTSLVNRFCHNVFDRDYKATIGVDFEVEKFSILSMPFTLQLWDTAGQERFKAIAASYYRGANAVVVAFDLCDIHTLTTAKVWYKEAMKAADDPVVFLVGMKRDLLSDAAYKQIEVEAMRMADELNAEYWPTSAKSGENVKDFFFRLVALTFNHMVVAEMSAGKPQPLKSIGNSLITMRSRDDKNLYEKKKCCVK